MLEEVPIATEITYALVWIPAVFSVYFNLKHAIIPDLDFGFIKALRPYNVTVLCLGFAELFCLTSWYYINGIMLVVSTSLFAALTVLSMISARKGVEKWKI
jgi:hypothetical protein